MRIFFGHKNITIAIGKDTTKTITVTFPIALTATIYGFICMTSTNNTSSKGASFTNNIDYKGKTFCSAGIGNQAESTRTLTYFSYVVIGY